MINQRQPQVAGSLQSSQVQLVPEQQEVWRQTSLSQKEDVIRAQLQVRLGDVQQRESEHLTVSGLRERERDVEI